MSQEPAIAIKSFCGPLGGAEHFILATAPARGDLPVRIAALEDAYGEAQRALGLGAGTAVFRRLFASDLLTQSKLVKASGLADSAPADPVAVSFVQQPPLPEAKIALLAYHIADPRGIVKNRISPHHLLVEKRGRRHLWSSGLCAAADERADSVGRQMRAAFEELIAALGRQGACLRDHCLRTWIYLKDIDVFYSGMVEARRSVFAAEGLNEATHYIASTGIEGACTHRFDLVMLDAYSAPDLVPGQVTYLNNFDHLCAPGDYGVAFERGSRIAYADRTHYFISGTASIDRAGRVVHPGKVLHQLDHALENVAALLHAGGAKLDDLTYLLVYLRDPLNYVAVAAHLAERFVELPRLIVQGAVCRQEWLVEIEGFAIGAADDPALPAF